MTAENVMQDVKSGPNLPDCDDGNVLGYHIIQKNSIQNTIISVKFVYVLSSCYLTPYRQKWNSLGADHDNMDKKGMKTCDCCDEMTTCSVQRGTSSYQGVNLVSFQYSICLEICMPIYCFSSDIQLLVSGWARSKSDEYTLLQSSL